MHRLRGQNGVRRPDPVSYWKPIQTGIEQDDDTAIVRTLGDCKDSELLDVGVRLPRPLSPHLSAALAGETLDIERAMAPLQGIGDSRAWIVEGAGGVLVPLNDSQLMVDLMVRLRLPVLVVARSGLGTINHTLLTLEALRARRLAVAGILMVGTRNAANRAAIESRGGVAVVGELPVLDPLDAATLGNWARTHLDPGGQLMEHVGSG
jgi:dethiobiotin synthase